MGKSWSGEEGGADPAMPPICPHLSHSEWTPPSSVGLCQPGGGLRDEPAQGPCLQGGHIAMLRGPRTRCPATELLTQGGEKKIHSGREAKWLSLCIPSALPLTSCLRLMPPHARSSSVMEHPASSPPKSRPIHIPWLFPLCFEMFPLEFQSSKARFFQRGPGAPHPMQTQLHKPHPCSLSPPMPVRVGLE